MRIDIPAAMGEAWALLKRDRDPLIALTGLFIFLPTLATLLLVRPAPAPPPADADKAVIANWANVYAEWLASNFPGMAAASLFAMLGALTILVFCADPARPSVADAIMKSIRKLPGYVLQVVLVSIPVSMGFLGLIAPPLFILLLPGLWVLGRALMASVGFAAAQLGPIAAIGKSFAWTRGNGLTMAGLAAIGAFGGEVLAAPFTSLDHAMRIAHAENPIAVIVAGIGAAASVSVVALAMLLLRVAIYWRVSASSNGI